VEHTFNTAPRGAGDTNDKRLSPALLVGLAFLMMALLAAVLTARLTGFDASAVPESPVVDSRLLDFRDLPGGVVEVYDWETGALLSRIPSGEGSFLRGVVRSLVRQRRGVSGEVSPFTLALHADQRLMLSDPQTGEAINLNAFGPTNLAVFTALMAGPVSGPVPGGA
jgi:putative photosynthetic complex assembly protein